MLAVRSDSGGTHGVLTWENGNVDIAWETVHAESYSYME